MTSSRTRPWGRARLGGMVVLLALAAAGCRAQGVGGAEVARTAAARGSDTASSADRSTGDAARRPGPGDRSGRPGARELPPVTVIVEPAGTADMSAHLEASSTRAAETSVDVVAEATGIVVERARDIGDAVERGDLLARLAYEGLELAERRARNELRRLEADFERQRALAEENLISDEEFQQVRFDLERARIDWEQARLELERTRIEAPIAGIVTDRTIHVGSLVRVNDVVFRLFDPASLIAPVHLPERYLPRLRRGQRAELEVRAAGERWRPARIRRIAPAVDADSGTVEVVLEIADRRGLRPGMFATARIVLDEHRGVVVVPKQALVFDDELPHVFVVDPATATADRRRIETGYEDDTRVEVVRGVAAGEMIVVVGQAGLKPGSRVVAQDGDGEVVAAPPAGDGETGAPPGEEAVDTGGRSRYPSDGTQSSGARRRRGAAGDRR